jgi:hypothetical protein
MKHWFGLNIRPNIEITYQYISLLNKELIKFGYYKGKEKRLKGRQSFQVLSLLQPSHEDERDLGFC